MRADILPSGFSDGLTRYSGGNDGRSNSWQRTKVVGSFAVLHVQQSCERRVEIFAYSDWRAPTSAAGTEVGGRSFDRNRTMILRELHIDIRKFPVAGIDARDERVVRHVLFFLAKRERLMLECKKKQQMWQQSVVTVSGFLPFQMVEPMGFEPTTSSMPSRRAPNCATAPPSCSVVNVSTGPSDSSTECQQSP
jgi:hypothetical protein